MAGKPDDEATLRYKRQVSDNLKALRARSGMSLAALAKATGIARSTLGAYEGSKNRLPSLPTAGHLEALAEALQTTVQEITGEPTPVHLLWLDQLKKRARVWRLKDLSLVPEKPLQDGLDEIITRHKNSLEDGRPLKAAPKDSEQA